MSFSFVFVQIYVSGKEQSLLLSPSSDLFLNLQYFYPQTRNCHLWYITLKCSQLFLINIFRFSTGTSQTEKSWSMLRWRQVTAGSLPWRTCAPSRSQSPTSMTTLLSLTEPTMMSLLLRWEPPLLIMVFSLKRNP